eukprot:scaffold7538_cov248-Pinguiococcus_pyrenoidosus.AAC.2
MTKCEGGLDRPLYGVGHSMGASGLILTALSGEAARLRGGQLFNGLLLFEPILVESKVRAGIFAASLILFYAQRASTRNGLLRASLNLVIFIRKGEDEPMITRLVSQARRRRRRWRDHSELRWGNDRILEK